MITNDSIRNTGSNPPPFKSLSDLKYSNGVMYFNISSWLFILIADDMMNVPRRIAVATEGADLGCLLIAAVAVPITRNISCKINIPTINMYISPVISSPPAYFPIRATEKNSVTRLNTTILKREASNFAVIIFPLDMQSWKDTAKSLYQPGHPVTQPVNWRKYGAAWYIQTEIYSKLISNIRKYYTD
jgi:hypothetical protein